MGIPRDLSLHFEGNNFMTQQPKETLVYKVHMKRSAAEMEGGAGEEEEGEEEEEGDAEEEGDEEGEDEREEQRQGQHEEGEDADEDEMGEAEDNIEEEVEEHHTPKHTSVKSKKGVSHSDDEEYERSAPGSVAARAPSGKVKDNEDDDEENLDIDFAKSQTADTAKLIAIMAQFTTDQMSRFECYRRSNFQKTNMRRLLQSVAGCTISLPMTIVMSGIAKMFVGELIETARTVMTERKETGPTRPCHIREAYRRLKLKGKVPLRSRPRLFH